ncbi:MAG: hypothetical protein JXO44_14915 [Clostridia bacterium]|nr:hypothetical protein [Clostridia bacterium]
MNKKKKILLSGSLSAFLFMGCASDHSYRLQKGDMAVKHTLGNEQVVSDYYKKRQALQAQNMIDIYAQDQWVYTLAQKVAKQNRIPLDRTFIPSTDYRVSARGKYTLGEFLDMVYKQTGVNYILDDGYLKVKNSEFLDAHFPANKGCGDKGATRFTLSLKEAPLSRIFGYFVEKKGYTVQYDLHNSESVDSLKPISFSYRGCSVRDALQRIAKATDLKIIYKKGKILEVRDYDTLKANVPSYYNLAFSSTSSSLGENKGTGTQLSDKTDPSAEFKSILETFMSEKGKAYISGRGYIVVEDKPSYIERLKKILNKEISAQKDMELDITIVSVELNDEYKSGVDWQKILEPSFLTTEILDPDTGAVIDTTTTAQGYRVGADISQKIGDGALNLSHLTRSGKLSMLQLLGQYGETKVVKEHHLATRSGVLSTLKAVEIIPYVTETSQVSNGISQTQKEAKSIESGIIINIKPTIEGSNVNMNVDITISEYLGDKEVAAGFTLPKVKTNSIQAPLNAKLGDTTLLTGISLKSDVNTYAGIPNGNRTGLFSVLGGKNEDSIGKKEYLIFIKPSRRVR